MMINKEEELTRKNYSATANHEWKRVVRDPFHRLEYDGTMRALKKYLPKKGLILDAGGGPGRYSIELTKQGYQVVLFDLVQENLDLAKKKARKEKLELKQVMQGSITDLSRFEDNTFDAVLCLGGPLSHVSPEKNREKAVRELVRVAKPGSPVFISVMSYYSVLLGLSVAWQHETQQMKYLKEIVFQGDDYRWRGKGYCHFYKLKEITGLMERAGLKVLGSTGLEGVNPDKKIAKKFLKKYPKGWSNWVKVHEQISSDPLITETSQHMLLIGKK